MTPEQRVWRALTSVPGEAYEPCDIVTMTGLPAVVVESILSNLERRGFAYWDPKEMWYEARPTTLDAPWLGCGCDPVLYPTPGAMVVLANGDIVQILGYTPNPYAVQVSGRGWVGVYQWSCMVTGLPIEEVWSGRKPPRYPWCVTGHGYQQCGQQSLFRSE